MAAVQEALKKAARHLGDLTLSQRLAIGLGALLVVGSLAWLAQWAATPEMVPLLPGQTLEADELALVRTGLDALGQPHEVVGSQVLVRASANRQAILASLQQAGKLPADTAIGFAELVKEANPWISQEENSRRWTVALQSELARVLSEFSGVKQARVLLNLNAKPRGFSRQQPEASAGVTLFTRGGEPVGHGLALAAARLVAGAVRGLPVKNVQVIDGANGRVALDWDREEPGSPSNLHRQRQELEREKEQQIKEQLSFDPHVLVSVSCEIDPKSQHVQEATPIEGVPTKEETDSTSTVRNRRSGQPGVQPNTGMEVGSGSSADSSTSERSTTTYTPGMRTSTQEVPPGAIKRIAAAVSLSHSYLLGVYRLNNPGAQEPTEDQIEELFGKQKDKIAAHVAKLLIPPDPEQVSVVWHYDTLLPEVTPAASALDTSLDALRRYGSASGLALLAVVALGMMLRLARQQAQAETFGMEIGLPKEAIEKAKKAAEDVRAAAARPAARARGAGAVPAAVEDEAANAIPLPVGQAADGVLDAQEVPESEVQVAQMLTQVSAMTEKDTDAVAALVEGWIERGR